MKKKTQPRVKGHGDYVTDAVNKALGNPSGPVARLARTAGEAVGSRIGKLLGNSDRGKSFGGSAMQGLAKLFGHGDYAASVTDNSIIQGQAVASFQNNGRGLRLTHREFIANVQGTTDFSINGYPINPALAQTFPFLSRIASLFEEYEFDGLVFEFVTTSGMVSATSAALGAVIMATDYDSYSELFQNKQQMESYQFAISTVPYRSAAHGVECAKTEKTTRNLYTRTGFYKGSLLDYDFGLFQIATQGLPSNYTVGELWVTYDVRLLKPRLPKNFAIVPSASYVDMPTLSRSDGRVDMFPVFNPSPNGYETFNSFGTPFFDVSLGFGAWKGEVFGFLPGARALYILRGGTYRVECSIKLLTTAAVFATGIVAAVTPGTVSVAPTGTTTFALGSHISTAAFPSLGTSIASRVTNFNGASTNTTAGFDILTQAFAWTADGDWNGDNVDGRRIVVGGTPVLVYNGASVVSPNLAYVASMSLIAMSQGLAL